IRVLSDEREYDIAINYRQDFQSAAFAWGGRVRMLAERPLFKANETDIYEEEYDVQLFFETARWLNAKLRVTLDDIFNRNHLRNHRVFAGKRHLAPILLHERRIRSGGRRVTL